jgi:hypothetical protein
MAKRVIGTFIVLAITMLRKVQSAAFISPASHLALDQRIELLCDAK